MGRLHRGGVFASLLVIAGLVACVGDDPDVFVGPGPGPDGSTSGGDGGTSLDDTSDPPDAGDGDGPSTVTCSAPLEACGTACVDKQTSGQHCGRCDRACGQGSSCSAGRCSPVVLASGLASPSALAVADSVVVIALGDILVRCGKDGCGQGPTHLWQSTAWTLVPGALSLSADRTQAFFLGRTTTPPFPPETNLYRVNVGGTAPLIPSHQTTALVPSYVLGNSTRLATDAREHAIASPYRNHRCFQASCETVALASNQETPTSITLTPTHYAWTIRDGSGGATVQTCPRPPKGATSYEGADDCGTPLALAPSITQSTSDHVASHENVVYWADWSQNGGATGRVLACAPSGCNGAPTVIAAAEQAIDGLAVDASGVYWTNGSAGTVRVCRDLVQGCGTNAETIASGASDPGPIALDDGFVYFIARGGTPDTGALLKVAK